MFMMRLFYLFCVFLCWEFAPATVFAAKVADLYDAEVPVIDQGAEARAAGLREALATVLLKVSGRMELPRQGLGQVLDRAQQIAQQYRYRLNDAPVPANASPAGNRYLLWARFDEAQVNAILNGMGLPVWGGTRPSVLVWLAVEEGGQRYLAGGEAQGAAQRGLQSHSRQRGLPLLLPLLDLEDQRRITVTDVWGNFRDTINEASARYQADAILTGRVFQGASGLWQGHWTLYESGEAQGWNASAQDLDALVGTMVAQVTGTLAQRYAHVVDPNARSFVTLDVSAVETLADYARLMRYLRSLDNVKGAQVLRSEADRLRVRVEVLGDAQALARLISLGQVLAPATVVAESGVDRSYRLNP